MDKSTDLQPALEAFIAKQKFMAEGRYPGAMSEADRQRFERQINTLAERLMKGSDSRPTKERVLSEFKAFLPSFENADTEERERALDYLVEIMDIYGIESSDGLLNKWRYGFDPSQSEEVRNSEARASMSASEREFVAALEKLTAVTAEATLTQYLGPPSVRSGAATIWMDASDPNRGVSISTQGGKTFVIWMNKGQFLYSRELQ